MLSFLQNIFEAVTSIVVTLLVTVGVVAPTTIIEPVITVSPSVEIAQEARETVQEVQHIIIEEKQHEPMQLQPVVTMATHAETYEPEPLAHEKPPVPPPQVVQEEQVEQMMPVVETPETVEWRNGVNGWEPSITPPACPEPLQLKTPTDLTRATSILYPGQYRGDDYKPHGGFRYDNSLSTDIEIVAPMDARVVDGSRMFANGEIQYMFDFIAPCGIWYRFGHLRALPPKFAAIAETLPEPVEGDSRTHELGSTITVTAGETIATAVGFMEENNIFVDWGVYDLRSKNKASEDPVWSAQHPGGQEQYAVCWFDFLSPEDEAIVRSLPPADGVNKDTSDYCN